MVPKRIRCWIWKLSMNLHTERVSKPQRGDLNPAQGNALGEAIQRFASPVRAAHSRLATALWNWYEMASAVIGAPFQGLAQCGWQNPGRCPGLWFGRAVGATWFMGSMRVRILEVFPTHEPFVLVLVLDC